VFGYGDGHTTDRPGTGYQYIFSNQVIREGSVDRVSKRIEAGKYICGYVRVTMPDIGDRDRQIFSERAIPIHADTFWVGAEMSAPG
jgi:hypothetical protein